MTANSYFSGAAELKPEIPDEAPTHLVDELLSVIELWRGSIPSTGQCEAMQRLAHAIREES